MEDVAVGVHLVAHLHGVAVDLHAALGDDLLGGAAGAEALLAHDFLNAFFCHDKISLCASRRSNRAADELNLSVSLTLDSSRTVALRSNDGEVNYSSLSIKTAGRKPAVTT